MRVFGCLLYVVFDSCSLRVVCCVVLLVDFCSCFDVLLDRCLLCVVCCLLFVASCLLFD